METCLADDAKAVNCSLCLDRFLGNSWKGGDSGRHSVVVEKGLRKKEDPLCEVCGFRQYHLWESFQEHIEGQSEMWKSKALINSLVDDIRRV